MSEDELLNAARIVKECGHDADDVVVELGDYTNDNIVVMAILDLIPAVASQKTDLHVFVKAITSALHAFP